MRYRVIEPTIPEIVRFVIKNVLPNGFYTYDALPTGRLVIELMDLPPHTYVKINGQPYRTNAEGKVTYTVTDLSSENRGIVVEYSTGSQSIELQGREYVNLTWITLQSFIQAYFALYASRRLQSITNTNLPVFHLLQEITNHSEDLDQLIGEGFNKFWTSALGGLLSPETYPGIGNIHNVEPDLLSLLQYTPDVMLYYYLEGMLSNIFGVEVKVGFLPVNMNVYRMGLDFLLKEIKLANPNPHVTWMSEDFISEVFFNNINYAGPKTHNIPPYPTEEGSYVLTYSPDPKIALGFTHESNYKYQKLDSDHTPIVGYNISEMTVRALWNENRKCFETVLPILTDSYGILYEAGTPYIPLPVRKSPTQFCLPGDTNYGTNVIFIKGLAPQPNIPVIAFKVGSGGGVSDVYDPNRLLITDIESLSGVDVFVSARGYDGTNSMFKAMTNTVWLVMEKATYPSFQSIGWIGIDTNHLSGNELIPGFKSTHRRS